MSSFLPQRGRGRQTAEREAEYQDSLAGFVETILEMRWQIGFAPSSRGWCYALENRGLITKSEFKAAETLIGDLRKAGRLAIDIVAEDSTRQFSVGGFDAGAEPGEYSDDAIANWAGDATQLALHDIRDALTGFRAFSDVPSLWQHADAVVLMMVEKIDLKTIYSGICDSYGIPIANAKGWGDINIRAYILRYFMPWHHKRCVILYCGDHDPAGFRISEKLKENLANVSGGYFEDQNLAMPPDLVIDRFGLNRDFIEEHRLSWIDNLETSGGKDLAAPSHPDHALPYVQDYIAAHGARKVEANALVTAASAGRQLCRDAVRKYIPDDVLESWRDDVSTIRRKAWAMRAEAIKQAVNDGTFAEEIESILEGLA